MFNPIAVVCLTVAVKQKLCVFVCVYSYICGDTFLVPYPYGEDTCHCGDILHVPTK